jgi:hypothetical protein
LDSADEYIFPPSIQRRGTTTTTTTTKEHRRLLVFQEIETYRMRLLEGDEQQQIMERNKQIGAEGMASNALLGEGKFKIFLNGF